MRMTACLLLPFIWALTPLSAQILRDSAPNRRLASPVSVIEIARAEQKFFEDFRRIRLPVLPPGLFHGCKEEIGRLCYWYDELTPPYPREPSVITRQRLRMLSLFDSLGRIDPEDAWLASQRVRYYSEIERYDDALRAARGCAEHGPYCDQLVGFAFHMLGRFASADSAFAVAIDKMDQANGCQFRDISLLIDADTRKAYRVFRCGDPRRVAFEDRLWFLSRTLYSRAGNDSRTEYYSRETMVQMVEDAENLYQFGLDGDEQEILLRYGWTRAWAAGAARPVAGFTFSANVNGASVGNGGAGGRGTAGGIEPMPAYRIMPSASVFDNPAMSDTTSWGIQYPPVRARYAPGYARTFKSLEHQEATFRRGDSALVVMAYDARPIREFNNTPVNAALVVMSVDAEPHEYVARANGPASIGALTVKAPWGPLLMSVEAAAPDKHTVARSRYGLSHFVMPDARVTLSDLLMFKPYGSAPESAEEAAPHALNSDRVRADETLGVYWEAYGTDPTGEKMSITLTVVRELGDDGFLRRMTKSIGLGRSSTPVSVSVQDVSARGGNRTPRALELNIGTLSKGSYVVELEVELAGQVVMRADHHIEVVSP